MSTLYRGGSARSNRTRSARPEGVEVSEFVPEGVPHVGPGLSVVTSVANAAEPFIPCLPAALTNQRRHGAVWNRRRELEQHGGQAALGCVALVDGDVLRIDDGELLEGERVLGVGDGAHEI